MKRFFLIFSILLVIFLALTAGCLAAVQYGSIQAYQSDPPFVFGWGITQIPYNGNLVVYPQGEIYLVRKYNAQAAIEMNTVVLVTVPDGKVKGIISGLVTGTKDGSYVVEGTGGYQLTVHPGNVVGIYMGWLRGLKSLLDSFSSPLSILAFTLVLAASIAFWRLLPGKPEYAGLSRSDDQISSNLY